jgi:hypothetical protein
MKNKNSYIIAILILVALVSSALFVLSLLITNPTKLGPGGVTFWFIDLLLMLISLSTLGIYSYHSRRSETKSRVLVSSFRTGSLIGFTLTLLFALSSLRSLSWRDIILLVLLVALVEILFRTRRSS